MAPYVTGSEGSGLCRAAGRVQHPASGFRAVGMSVMKPRPAAFRDDGACTAVVACQSSGVVLFKFISSNFPTCG